jgi:hypothetical protein
MPNLFSSLLNTASARSAGKREAGLLKREFAGYRKPIDRDDLEIFARRYTTEQTPEAREILGRQAARLY